MNRPHGSDHKFTPHRPRSASANQQPRRLPQFLRIRRSRKATLLVVLSFLAFSYYSIAFFFSYPTYNGDESDSYNPLQDPRRFPPRGSRSPLWSYRPQSDLNPNKDDGEYTYDLGLRFPYLYRTISKASFTGRSGHNRIVLFAAGNVESASKLAILACEMAREKRNMVHLAFMMRDQMDINKWATMNNVGDGLGDCEVSLHDARLDHAGISTLRRSKLGVKGALGHFRSFLHPQVILVDGEGEQGWWLESLKQGCEDIATPTILLPKGFMRLASWLKKLDSGALRSWNDLKIQIVVKVGEHNGNLIRLLRSLAAADMFGLKKETFQLTVEIPRRMQPSSFTFDFLRGYSWPSRDKVRLKRPLTLASDSPDTVTAAIRFAEEWYPSDDNSYLLLLDDNVEVSEFFWHWVWYNVLQYRHSYNMESVDTDLYGMSLLPLPSDFFPTGEVPLVGDVQSQFLLTTPSANATILFPKHFLHYRYYLFRLDQNITTPFEKSPHFIKGTVDTGVDPLRTPHYLRPLHSLAKARGWSMLYPSLPSLSKSPHEIPVYLCSHQSLPSTPRLSPENQDQSQPRQILATTSTAGLSYLPNDGDLLNHESLRWVDEETGKAVLDDADVIDVELTSRNVAALRYRMGITGCYDDEQNNGGWRDSVAAVWDLFCPLKSIEEIKAEADKKEKELQDMKEQARLVLQESESSTVPEVEEEELEPNEVPVAVASERLEEVIATNPLEVARETKAEEVQTEKPKGDLFTKPAVTKDTRPEEDPAEEPVAVKSKKPWRNKLGQVENGVVKDGGQEIPDEVQVAGRLFKVPKPTPDGTRIVKQEQETTPSAEALKPHQQEKMEQKLDLSEAGLLIATGTPPIPK